MGTSTPFWTSPAPTVGHVGNERSVTSDRQCMNRSRTGTLAAALALTAATTVAVAPAHAAPAPAETATVQYVAADSGSLAGGSAENEFVQVGLVLIAGLGVSALLAIAAGVQGGAFPMPEIPGLPL